MRVLIVGASGIVGRLLCEQLRDKSDWTIALAGRNTSPLTALASEFEQTPEVFACDVSQPRSLSQVLTAFKPELVVNLAGDYTTTAITVAETCLAARVMLFDICDEPRAMVPLKALHERAVAAGVPMVIGGGTAPQTSCALLRLVIERCDPGVELRMGFVLGLNRYGPNAVQTVSRGVSGLMSHGVADNLWSVGPMIPFPAPFGPLRIRKYPVPETVLLGDWPGIDTWFAGARLSLGIWNAYVRLLQQLGMTQWGVARFWNSLVASLCRAVYHTHLVAPGIALGIEALRKGRCVKGVFYHPEMSQLTAHALLVSLEQFARGLPAPGVWWGHEVVDPLPFLEQMTSRGLVWSIEEKALP